MRTNPEKISIDEYEEPEGEVDADIEKNMIEPLYGVELVADLRHRRTEYQWLVGLITEIAGEVVSLSEPTCSTGAAGGQRKRKLDRSPDRTSKHIRRADNYCDNTASDIDQEEETNDSGNSQSPKRYKNPFHEDTSDDEIEIEETVSFSRKRRNNRMQSHHIGLPPVKMPIVRNIHEINTKIYSSIEYQVQEAEKRKSSKVFVGSRSLFFCEICEVSCDTKEVLNIHKRGKVHMKNVKKSSAQHKKHSCEICHIECTDENSLIMHLKGKKHLKVISALARSFVPTVPKQSENSRSEVVILSDDGNDGDIDEEEIEIINPEKSREDILAGLPNCSHKGTIRWNSQDIFSLVPKNTIKLEKKVSSLNVVKFFQSNDEKRREEKVPKRSIIEEDAGSERVEDEVIFLDEDDDRPYRGFYPAQEFVESTVRGHHHPNPATNSSSQHARPPPSSSKRGEEKVAPSRTGKEEEGLNSLARRAEEWRRAGQFSNESVDVVDLGSSSSEDEDSSMRTSEEDDSSQSSSEYSDDVSAHSELRHFKTGPLASLWTFENKVGPLICPEMAGSFREIFGRIQMDPSERNYATSELEEEDVLSVTYDVYLAEHFKKNTKKSPSYRVVIQEFNSPLPSPRALYDLDQRYPDSVPFLFAVVSGGTVCFFNMERIELRSYYQKI